MGYITIYEASPNRFNIFPFAVLLLIEVLLATHAILNWKKNAAGGRVGMVLVGTVLLIGMTGIVVGYASSQSIFRDYQKGSYQTAKGVIENYEVGTEEKDSFPDRFTVDGAEFIIAREPSTGYGYSFRQCDGGELHDGLSCIIYYMPYRFENVIVKIMICEE